MSNVPIGRNFRQKQNALQTIAWFIVLLMIVCWSMFAGSLGITRASAPVSPVMAIPRLIRHDSALPAPFMAPLPDTPVTC